MTKMYKGQETVHLIPVPLKVQSQISLDLLGPLKEVDGCTFIVTAMDYTS